MPRIYDSASNPVDFCRACMPDEWDARERFGNVGEGPDGRGDCFDYDCAGPPYEETDYVCEDCGDPLTRLDD